MSGKAEHQPYSKKGKKNLIPNVKHEKVIKPINRIKSTQSYIK